MLVATFNKVTKEFQRSSLKYLSDGFCTELRTPIGFWPGKHPWCEDDDCRGSSVLDIWVLENRNNNDG